MAYNIYMMSILPFPAQNNNRSADQNEGWGDGEEDGFVTRRGGGSPQKSKAQGEERQMSLMSQIFIVLTVYSAISWCAI